MDKQATWHGYVQSYEIKYARSSRHSIDGDVDRSINSEIIKPIYKRTSMQSSGRITPNITNKRAMLSRSGTTDLEQPRPFTQLEGLKQANISILRKNKSALSEIEPVSTPEVNPNKL